MDTLNAAYGLRLFLDAAQDPTTTVLRAGKGSLRVNGLSRVNGETYAVDFVLDRLAVLTESPEKPEPPADVQPLAPRIGKGVWVSPNR